MLNRGFYLKLMNLGPFMEMILSLTEMINNLRSDLSAQLSGCHFKIQNAGSRLK